jgi:hypothetical protein
MTFVNHGCNGTYNVGVKSEFHELNVDINDIPIEYVDNSEPYNPVRERGLMIEEMVSLKDLKAGDELADNYLSYGGEKYFEDNVEQLRTDCAGGFGLVGQYQRRYNIQQKASQLEELVGLPPNFLQLQNFHERPAVSAHDNFRPLDQWDSRLDFDFEKPRYLTHPAPQSITEFRKKWLKKVRKELRKELLKQCKELREVFARDSGLAGGYECLHSLYLKRCHVGKWLGQPPKFLQLQKLHERPAVSAHQHFHPLAQWNSRLDFDFDKPRYSMHPPHSIKESR